MFSYEFYKVIHLSSLMFLFSSLSVQLLGQKRKIFKILTGIATLFTLVSGMGLMARLGIGHGETWPLWIFVKLSIWLIVGIGGVIVAKRFPKLGFVTYFVMMSLFIVAALTANYKF
jgi:uncharacterized membrane protein SirB2